MYQIGGWSPGCAVPACTPCTQWPHHLSTLCRHHRPTPAPPPAPPRLQHNITRSYVITTNTHAIVRRHGTGDFKAWNRYSVFSVSVFASERKECHNVIAHAFPRKPTPRVELPSARGGTELRYLDLAWPHSLQPLTGSSLYKVQLALS